MPTSRLGVRTAFVKESTAFTAESDWATNGKDLLLAAYPDPSGIDLPMVQDMRVMPRANARGGVSQIGLKNGEFPVEIYLTGKDETTSDGSQVAESDLMTALAHMFGGLARGNKTTAKTAGTHSSTQVELTSATNYAVGHLVNVIDADDADGVGEVRQVKTVSGDIITFDEELSFTPADGDVVSGMATIYIDPDVLADSSAANRQLAWRFEYAANDEAVIELIGTRSQPSILGLARNELLRVGANIMASLVRTSGRDSLTAVLAGTPTGGAPVVLGPRTKFFLQDYGTTTQTAAVHPVSINSIDPGIAVVRGEAQTSQADNAQGHWGFSTTFPVSPTMEIQVVPHEQDYETELEAGTFKVVRVARQNTEGKIVAFCMPRAEILHAQLSPAGEVLGHTVRLLGHENTDSIGTTHIAKSPLVIGLG